MLTFALPVSGCHCDSSQEGKIEGNGGTSVENLQKLAKYC